MPRKRLENTPDNIRMVEQMKTENGIVKRGTKCGQCNGYLRKGFCITCYVKNKNKKEN